MVRRPESLEEPLDNAQLMEEDIPDMAGMPVEFLTGENVADELELNEDDLFAIV